MATPLLELCDVSHRFGDTVALDHVTLAVRPGTVHALLGENGAGKTTLMRIAFGMVAPDAGRIRVEGRGVHLRAPADAIAQRIGMVHQHFTLVPAMTAAENVALGGRGRLDVTRVAAALHLLSTSSGLPVDLHARAETLPIAAQQRLEILKALYQRARVLILDEPTAVLAPTEAEELLRWLRTYAAQGNAVVLITHKLGEALAVADDVTVLRHGRVTARSAAKDMSLDSLTAAMLGTTARADARPAASPRIAEPPAIPSKPKSAHAIVARLSHASAAIGRERIADATIAVASGEIVAIAGVEGSGHHTLLRLLGGRIAPASGTVELPAHIGFVPEDRLRDALIADDTIAVNVALKEAGRRRGRMHWAHWRDRAVALVGAHDVRGATGAGAWAAKAGSLSGGNQQKLVIGRELGGSPSLVVAEHPTRGLDVRASAMVMEKLRAAALAGAGVVIHSPELDELLEVCDRILVVHGGRVAECVRDRDAVGRAMLGLA